jgi:hypothetical protein
MRNTAGAFATRGAGERRAGRNGSRPETLPGPKLFFWDEPYGFDARVLVAPVSAIEAVAVPPSAFSLASLTNIPCSSA